MYDIESSHSRKENKKALLFPSLVSCPDIYVFSTSLNRFPSLAEDDFARNLALGDLWVESPKSQNPPVQIACFTCWVLVIYSSHDPGIFRKVMRFKIYILQSLYHRRVSKSSEWFALGGWEWSRALPSRQCFWPTLVKSQVGLSGENKGEILEPQWHLFTPHWALSLSVPSGGDHRGGALSECDYPCHLVFCIMRTRSL